MSIKPLLLLTRSQASYSDTAKARRVYADVVKTTLRLGSTTVAYNSSIHTEATNILAETAFRAGQRAIVGKMCVTQGSTGGNWEESVEASLNASEESIRFIRGLDPKARLIHSCVQPRGGPYCPPELMEGLGKQREKYDAYVQGHMCETQDDIGRFIPWVSVAPEVADSRRPHAPDSRPNLLQLHVSVPFSSQSEIDPSALHTSSA